MRSNHTPLAATVVSLGLVLAAPLTAHAATSGLTWVNTRVQNGTLVTQWQWVSQFDQAVQVRTARPSLSLVNCELIVIAEDSDGAIGVTNQSIPCLNGTYGTTDTSIDGVDYRSGDTELLNYLLLAADPQSGVQLELASGNITVTAG
jgi:hypothetical protein